LGVMVVLWPLRPRSLHAGFWAGERVIAEREQKRFPKLEFSPSKHVTQTIEGCDAIGI